MSPFLCEKCRIYVASKADLLSREEHNHAKTKAKAKESDSDGFTGRECWVCLGLFSHSLSERISQAIRSAAEPYGGVEKNFFAIRTEPPRMSAPGDIIARFGKLTSSRDAPPPWVQAVKAHAKSTIMECIKGLSTQQEEIFTYPDIVHDEEQGFLEVYVLLVPAKNVPRPQGLFPPPSSQRNRKRQHYHQEDSQGGDPRINLEQKIQESGTVIFTINQALSTIAKPDSRIDLDPDVPTSGLDLHVAIWRRPVYIMGKYTKSRRDISQTPFYVVEQGQKQRLGESSVEEQILPVVSRHFGGISDLNKNSNNVGVSFGMVKFHASGREDMDVRMLLPEHATEGPLDDGAIGGRPFVCEITDALRLPLPIALPSIVEEVNASREPHPQSTTFYGENAYGVGISPILSFVSSSKYSSLQEETESKTKYYGCLCWSEKPLPADDASFGSYPLEIHQQTPLRVLHRRSNMTRIRHILSLRVDRVDDHYFRLHLSTDAGAYVKEFVHGDLGRTQPSISSILGCRTDILELDCEGVQTD